MNEESHWNNIAPVYEAEIFDVFKSDKFSRLSDFFRKHANRSHTALDFGCGVGKAFRYLAPSFKKLIAMDISDECIVKAKKGSRYRNIDYKQEDLSKPRLKLPLVNFVFCCNVIMLPEIEKNRSMIRNIATALKPGGHGLVVVPSMESIHFSSWRMIEWYRKEGVSPDRIPDSELDYYRAGKRNTLQGIIHIDKVATKHYWEPELHLLFAESGLKITAIEKIEYDWNTEFPEPPRWMKAPYPWDWLVECKKVRK